MHLLQKYYIFTPTPKIYCKLYRRLRKVKAKSHESQRRLRRPEPSPHPSPLEQPTEVREPLKPLQERSSSQPPPQVSGSTFRQKAAGLARAEPCFPSLDNYSIWRWTLAGFKSKADPLSRGAQFPSRTHTWVPRPPRCLAARLALECALSPARSWGHQHSGVTVNTGIRGGFKCFFILTNAVKINIKK